MDDSPTISSKLILPPDILYEIAQILIEHEARRTLLSLCLTSKRMYCLTTQILFGHTTVKLDRDMVCHLLQFLFDYFSGPHSTNCTTVEDRSRRDIWAPEFITRDGHTRTAWKCQWVNHLWILDVDLLCLPEISGRFASLGNALFPRLNYLNLVTDRDSDYIVSSALKIVAPSGSIRSISIIRPRGSRSEWDVDGLWPFVKEGLYFQSMERKTERILMVDQDIWRIFSDRFSYDRNSNEYRTLLNLLRKWSTMKNSNVAMTPHLVVNVRRSKLNGQLVGNAGQQWVLHALAQLGPGTEDLKELSWSDVEPLIQFKLVHSYVCILCGACGVSALFKHQSGLCHWCVADHLAKEF
ncbi:hypothetical protein TREMEDRAFT_65821 [Tremella mesenterica DSM 1558]|uniref:uncharacterized protein n=1 Tax=Tremella mesenterica (strain ATCC 24925 / CBS 8224 / DSM 1558 / NBRC 9311 / NRRL Y-6157 / RJB 2259-6 / UBC 559-6) TaxID=578456 RepID=UPI00032CDC6A|nr:uncharacterized protein TREMEDRAFT_65821 [Tremella mesenterica DSM 1558]EIW66213.1 hypothetical protein TREMEDRAFT_65821 [Tremella mesenterica DSM 1558]